jgi:rubrerythrin
MDNKQIKEIAKVIARRSVSFRNPDVAFMTTATKTAESIYNVGYRKERVGHWFIREYEFFTCSECGHDYWNSCDCTKEARERLAEGDTPNYCPNCGARMKGE